MSDRVRKAIIPVAGLGTRLLPATKAIPKEMLPLVDKPLIHYVVHEAAAAGLTEIILVTHESKAAIARYFTQDDVLETELACRDKQSLLADLQAIYPPDIVIRYVFQATAQGLGHAVLCARSMVGDAPFVVLLPDVIIDDRHCDLGTDNLAAMIALYEHTGSAQIMVDRVPKECVDQYGIADVGERHVAPGSSQPVLGVVEKPPLNKAPSDLAIVGRYVLPPDIWSLLEGLPTDKEIELTDALALLIKEHKIAAFHMVGKSHDCGNKQGYLTAFLHYALRHPTIGKALLEHVKTLALTEPPSK